MIMKKWQQIGFELFITIMHLICLSIEHLIDQIQFIFRPIQLNLTVKLKIPK